MKNKPRPLTKLEISRFRYKQKKKELERVQRDLEESEKDYYHELAMKKERKKKNGIMDKNAR